MKMCAISTPESFQLSEIDGTTSTVSRDWWKIVDLTKIRVAPRAPSGAVPRATIVVRNGLLRDPCEPPEAFLWCAPRSRTGRRPKLAVWTPTAGAAVRWVGGTICDTALSGWDVEVHIVDGGFPDALRILGACVIRPGESGADVAPMPESLRNRPSSATEFGHVLSVAAIAFKTRALKAAEVADTALNVESFQRITDSDALN